MRENKNCLESHFDKWTLYALKEGHAIISNLHFILVTQGLGYSLFDTVHFLERKLKAAFL